MKKTILAAFLMCSVSQPAMSEPTVLTVKSIRLISPSKATDGATDVLFGAFAAAAAAALTVATAGAGTAILGTTVTATQLGAAAGTAAGTGMKVGDALGKQFEGDDTLFFRINGDYRWPGKDGKDMGSQDITYPNVSFFFDSSRGLDFGLWEYDYASNDDFLGKTWFHDATSLSSGEYIVANPSENAMSALTVNIETPQPGCVYLFSETRAFGRMLRLCKSEPETQPGYRNLGTGPGDYSFHHAVRSFVCGPGVTRIHFKDGNHAQPWPTEGHNCNPDGFVNTTGWIKGYSTGVELF